ncbi:Small basic protein [Parafrankia irregularis]|uniref:Small basic protein n=1 Tax=Parafrankia irregularis TaxID=795642 RepID=A0A0S4QV89_9ACTN|nr:small basic family protein [Parafrankia irregularis]MBE3201908.1 small basic family protein [Parafrankia sp. CH37]CUU59505.1 Small basic protein [Parafrankia irregularis]
MTRAAAITGLVAIVVGVLAGLLATPQPPGWLDPYLPVAVLAAVDAAVGGLRAALERVFSDRVFVVSFLSNVVLAVALVALGDALGVGGALSTAVLVVFGIRIFTNAGTIRRLVLKS